MRRSGPWALGLISTPLSASQPPASRRSGPRLARPSGDTLPGSVKISAGMGSMGGTSSDQSNDQSDSFEFARRLALVLRGKDSMALAGQRLPANRAMKPDFPNTSLAVFFQPVSHP